jgi:4-oxalocrotonate tautomerase
LEKRHGKANLASQFSEKSAVAMGTVTVCDLSGSNTLFGKEIREREMPHVIVKLWPGRSEQEKKQLADAIVKDVVTYASCDESSVSVTIEEIKPADWAEKVYKPDILNKQEKLYKKPGYSM